MGDGKGILRLGWIGRSECHMGVGEGREGECSRAFHTGKPLRGFEESSQESKTGRRARSLVIEGKGQGLWPFPGPIPSRAEGKPSGSIPQKSA